MAVINNLTKEIGSYLLKDSKDPINWYPWEEKTFKIAIKGNKPVFLSIGYLSCHWCNVMSKESFSDPIVAEILNSNFVNIKVDREDRPDIDKFYMNSLLSMGIDGGWPLNIFLLPDGRPFYGGTYFENDIFISLIKDISDSFINHRERLEEASLAFVNTVNSTINKYYKANKNTENNSYSLIFCNNIFEKIYNSLDHKYGGLEGVKKFPLADLGIFLLEYNQNITKNNSKFIDNTKELKSLKLMLDNINDGGIYDHIGGGFSRYSIDSKWRIPHFEKMLYDNSQLISLYSKSYKAFKNRKYKKTVYDTIKFCIRELLDEDGGFYCSINSDSEGKEGKYYTWKKTEIYNLLGEDSDQFCKYYNIIDEGNWVKGENVLYANNFDDVNDELKDTIEICKLKLFNERYRRQHPLIDQKIIASWNAQMLIALLNAYKTFKEPLFLKKAKHIANFIKKYLIKDYSVWHTYYKGNVYQKGYLEDYAWIIKSFIDLYHVTLEEDWCLLAKDLLDSTFRKFYDEKDGFFFFSSLEEGELFSNKKYTLDGSIASANSIMCENLDLIGHLFNIPKYINTSDKMLKNMLSSIADDPTHFLYWANLTLRKINPFVYIIIKGEEYKNWISKINSLENDNILAIGSENISNIPLIDEKKNIDKITKAYFCVDYKCQESITNLNIVLDKIEKLSNKNLETNFFVK
ncbi:MAG: thioredoxin domain-containing protein [Bacteroidetes bacterium]|nr:thioredoxin domain-containing protein [Bacteroidota bacterium]